MKSTFYILFSSVRNYFLELLKPSLPHLFHVLHFLVKTVLQLVDNSQEYCCTKEQEEAAGKKNPKKETRAIIVEMVVAMDIEEGIKTPRKEVYVMRVETEKQHQPMKCLILVAME